MCGIVGILGFDPQGEENVRKMAQQLVHRGPDADGFFCSESLYMGHRRLSIIDLDARSNQPFVSASGRFVLIYNGEIYNYREIAGQLAREGVRLRAQSDTEVIVEAFERWGVGFVHRMVGMFAIVLHDLEFKTTYLFRDRIGKKPIYYFHQSGVLVLASEIKALRQHPLVQQASTIKRSPISTFLQLGFLPEPETFFSGVKKFPAGCYGIYRESKLTVLPYWNVSHYIKGNRTTIESKATDEFVSLLHAAVTDRMVADVPVGVFLSGGIDSSLVAAIASKQCKLKTFSIGFTDDRFDESQYAKKVADFLGTDHMHFLLTEGIAMEMLEKYLDHFDEPFADTSAIPTMLVSQMAAKKVKVALTGDGGDELFLGYGAYQWANRFDHPAWLLALPFIEFGVRQLESSKWKRISQMLRLPELDQRQHIFSQEQYFFAEKELSEGLLERATYDHWHFQDAPELRHLSAAERQALFDFQFYLREDLLVKVDRASMAFGLECRSPLLDHRLVEFAVNLPEELKLRRGDTKYLMKQILYQHIPEQFFNRPKWGFSVPLAKWLKGDMSYLLDYLSKENLQATNIFNEARVRELLARFKNGEDYLYNRLWVMIIVQRFLMKHGR